jgi:hypothetical protein
VEQSTVDASLTKSLHAADLLMGVYFGGLALASVYMGKAYIVSHSWWLSSHVCSVLAFVSTLSLVVSPLQEAVICVERFLNIVLRERRLWPGRRVTSLIILLIWVFGVSVFMLFVFVVGLSNRICLPLNFFEKPLERWYILGVVLFVLDFSCFVVMAWCAFRIHRKVLESASELQKMSEHKISSNKAYKNRLAVMLVIFLINMVYVNVLVVVPQIGVGLGLENHIFLFTPCLVVRPILNPVLYAWRKLGVKN